MTLSPRRLGLLARRATLLILLLALAWPLAACGKKGALDPPADAENPQYPRSYPTR